MNLARLIGFVMLAAAISKCVCFANDAASQDASNLLAHAASEQNIREEGAQPFQLPMHIHAEHVVAKPLDGAYAEIWLSPEKWRREIAFPGFGQKEVGDVDSKWMTRNLDFRPKVVDLAAIAVERFLYPNVQSEEAIYSLRNRKIKGLEVHCAEILGKERRSSRELCFDATGILAVESIGEQRFEYDHFDRFDGKILPKSIRVYEGDSKLLEINADGLSSPPDLRHEMFRHEPGARQMAPCERWPSDLEKKVPPQYPPDARNLHQQGSVALSTRLSPPMER